MSIELNTIDLSAYLSNPDPALPASKQAAEQLINAYKTHGFCYVKGWDGLVPSTLVDSVFNYNEKLFNLPQEKKDALAYTDPEANRGYLSLGRENSGDDWKETFEIGNAITPEYPEHWPQEKDLPGFKDTMCEFHVKAHELNVCLMRLLAISLNLDPTYFDSHINKRENNLRLLHYPAMHKDITGDTRLRAHSDDGTVTLLWQDFTGGLEILGPDGEWKAVVPKEGTLLVNVGDLLQRWSNDLLKSTIHRACLPEDKDGMSKVRRSIAYFGNPNRETIIACIPGLGTPKYEPVVAKKFYADSLASSIPVN